MDLAIQLINGNSLLIQDKNNAILIGAINGERFEALFKVMKEMKRVRKSQMEVQIR
jgi:hypothetical protein